MPRRSRKTGRPSLVRANPTLGSAALCLVVAWSGGCGGTSGRDDLASPEAGMGEAAPRDAALGADAGAMADAPKPDGTTPDSTVAPAGDAAADATLLDLDEGLFDVDIPHADRVLPDVQPVAAMDSSADAQDAGQSTRVVDGSACVPFNTPVGTDGGDAGAYACTPTEQRFVDRSVDCYKCLVNAACLDDSLFGDMGKECQDLSGNATGGDRAGVSLTVLCLAVIDCVLATRCAAPTDEAGTNGDVSACYCGTLNGSACATSSMPGNGACAQDEVNGATNAYLTDPASKVSPTLADVTLASGKADAIFACGQLNGCANFCWK